MVKRILLTGATGMVGRNILEHNRAKKYEFLTPSSHELNLLDSQKTRSFIQAYKPDMIIHTAGIVGGIQANIAQPVSFLVDNMQMGLNIINISFELGINKLINLSSSCMYPRNANKLLSEDDILTGALEPTNEGYALAKITTTKLCEYICKENPALQYKTIIPCNLYGRYDNFDPRHSHMIPAAINKIYNAKLSNQASVDIWGDGQARREFMYAGDLADFIFYAVERYEHMPQNINVGLGYDYTINEYYETVAKIIGFEGNFTYDLTKPVGMQRKLMDNSKLHTFGWESKTSLVDGLALTLKFFMESSDD